MPSENETMDAYFELFDLESGNVIEDYVSERDAIDALVQVVVNHGPQAIETFALTHVSNGKSVLIAMQDELVLRVEREMEQLALQRRMS
jgi:hypothetical protein